jgi:hypothetical protein
MKKRTYLDSIISFLAFLLIVIVLALEAFFDIANDVIIGCVYLSFGLFFALRATTDFFDGINFQAIFGSTVEYHGIIHLSQFILALLMIIFGYTQIYMGYGIIDTSTGAVNPVVTFRECFYFSVVTFTTLGYGDFKPSVDARLWASSQAILGYILLALLVAKLSKKTK